MNGDGSAVKKVTDILEQSPTMLSPDGSKVLVVRGDGLHIVNTDGSGEVAVGVMPAPLAFASLPRWSPDGTKFIVTEMIDDLPYVFIINSDGTQKTQISSKIAVGAAFSPDGKALYFFGLEPTEVEGAEKLAIEALYRVSITGTQEVRLADVTTNNPAADFATVPHMSPDGTRLAYYSLSLADVESGMYSGDLRIMTLDGEFAVQTVAADVNIFQMPVVSWAPNGQKLAFSWLDDTFNVDLCTVNSDGSGLKNITNTPGLLDVIMSYNAWTETPVGPNQGDANNDGIPDSQQPHVTSYRNPQTGKYVTLVAPTGSQITNLTTLSAEDHDVKDDGGFSYPLGLVNFTITGLATGADVPVEVLFHGADDQAAADLVARKFKTSASSVFTIDEAAITEDTIDNHKVLKASYTITDGGDLDNDGQANGQVTDPLGLGVNDRLADTGLDQRLVLLTALGLIGATIVTARVRQVVRYRLSY